MTGSLKREIALNKAPKEPGLPQTPELTPDRPTKPVPPPVQASRTKPGPPVLTPGTVSRSQKKLIARRGEEIAAIYLKGKGWNILGRNWRAGRFGELDLIARDGAGLTIFVEVKTRKKAPVTFGIPSSGFDAVDWRKRQKIVTSAKSYLGRKRQSDAACRFDIIVVYFEDSTSFLSDSPDPPCSVLHVEDIFSS